VGNPYHYYKFSFSDHARKRLFAGITPEASGIYLRLMAVAWESPRCGYLFDAQGRALHVMQLSVTCCITPELMTSCMAELRSSGALEEMGDKSLRLPLMVAETSADVTLKKRELNKERVARYRFKKSLGVVGNAECNAVMGYTDSDSDSDSVVNGKGAGKPIPPQESNSEVSIPSDFDIPEEFTRPPERPATKPATVPTQDAPKAQKPAKRAQTPAEAHGKLFPDSLTTQAQTILAQFPVSPSQPPKALESIKAAIKAKTFEEIQQAVSNLCDEVNSGFQELRFVAAPERWFQAKYLDYLGERWELRQRSAAQKTGKVKFELENFSSMSEEDFFKTMEGFRPQIAKCEMSLALETKMWASDYEGFCELAPTPAEKERYKKLALEKARTSGRPLIGYPWYTEDDFDPAKMSMYVEAQRVREKRSTPEQIRALVDTLRRNDFRKYWQGQGFTVLPPQKGKPNGR
jgi:hypothetical protein